MYTCTVCGKVMVGPPLPYNKCEHCGMQWGVTNAGRAMGDIRWIHDLYKELADKQLEMELRERMDKE